MNDNKRTELIKKKFQWIHICKLILIALPSIIFGILTIILTLQQNNFQQLIQKQDQEQIHEENLRLIYQNYINISNILFKKNFQSNESFSSKSHIILFLYETHLLRSDVPLRLNYLYLANIKATHLIFQWCHLTNANFDNSSIPFLSLSNVAITN
ncbi:hypothetical protein I4U23_004484 [Adineta vaga]|nr:hypothetical protein I4U23_004484 [Adineta vaga]